MIGVTDKLLWLWHEMWSEDRLRATEEVLMVHVDTAAGRASPFPDDLRARAEALLVPRPGARVPPHRRGVISWISS